MRRLLIASGAAALLVLAMVASVAAAGPAGRGYGAHLGDRTGAQADVVADVLGLTQAQVDDLRHDGLSLAQIAERQKVDPEKLVDALVAQWSSRIDARVQLGALTTDQANTLKAQLETRALEMVNRTALGGMQGAAVGAGPTSAGGHRDGTGIGGRGAGNGTCDGTGLHGASS
jgi:hypothetical protein